MMDQPTMRLNYMATARRFGFGPEVMKQTKVCRVCGCACEVDETYCFECGAFLPRETLFDLYKSYHPYCPDCGNIVPSRALFCPECGKRLRSHRSNFWSFRKKAGAKDG